MAPIEIAKTMRKKADHAAKISRDIPICIASISPDMAAHTSRYLTAQAEEMGNILMSLAIAEYETSVQDSASRLVSRYAALAQQTTREADLRGRIAIACAKSGSKQGM